jgi:phosphoribosylformylglycinamidine synthase
MVAIVNVKLKEGVLDPQGKAVHHALDSLGLGGGVEDVRIGKQVVMRLAHTDAAKAKEEVVTMCEELLANTVIEDYEIELLQ